MGLQSVKLKSWHAYSEKKGTLKEDERLAERFPWRVIGVARLLRHGVRRSMMFQKQTICMKMKETFWIIIITRFYLNEVTPQQ